MSISPTLSASSAVRLSLRLLPPALLAALLALFALVQSASATGHTNVNTDVQAFAAMLDASDDPVAPNAAGRYRITPVSGSATTVKIRVYMVKQARSTLPAPGDYANYGDFSRVYMGIGQSLWSKLDGATWSDTSLCQDQSTFYGAGGEDCNMDKSKWISNVRAADAGIRASDTEAGDAVHPFDFTITVPAGTGAFVFASITDCRSDASGCSYNGNPDNNEAGNNRIRNTAAQSFSSHTNVNTGVRAFVAMLDSDDEPIPPYAGGIYQIKPVSGSATTVKLRIYMVKAARTTLPAPGDYASYGDFSRIYMGIGQSLWTKLDGATWSDTGLCQDQSTFYGAGGEDCNMDRSVWISNVRAADAGIQASDTEETDPVHPLDVTITVPDGTANFVFASLTDCGSDATKCSYNGNPDNNQAGDNRIRNSATQSFSDTVFQAHVYRYQAAYYSLRPDGSVNWGDSSTMRTATHTYQSAALCTRAYVDPAGGNYAANSECNRDVRIGEAIYLPNTLLLQPGAARNSNPWLDETGATRITHGQYDTVTVSVAAGKGFIGINSLCPVDVLPHASSLEPRWAARDRTAAALASCMWRGTVYSVAGDTHWNGTGPLFFPTAAGTATVTVTYSKADDPDVIGDDSFTASDTLEIGVTATGAEPIKAYLGQRSLDSALTLQIGRKYADNLPSQWGFGPVTESGGEGYVAGATYADVDQTEAVVLSIPSGRLELLGRSGAVKSCSAERDSCTLTLSRADLKAGARNGWTGAASAGIEDSAPIFISKLRYTHAPGASEGVELTGTLKLADGTTETFSHTAEAAAGSSPAIVGYPREDADRVLAPGQTSPLSIGYRLPAGIAAGGSWRLFHPTSDIWSVARFGGYMPNVVFRAILGYEPLTAPLPATTAGAYLQLTGPATWTDSGGSRLRLDRAYSGKRYDHFTCVASTVVDPSADADATSCFITDGDGVAPRVTVAADAASDLKVTANLPIWTLNGEGDAVGGGERTGMPLGTEAHTNKVWLQGLEAFGSVTFRVGTVEQLSSISLGRKPGAGGVVPTSPVRIGSSSDVRLALLNENGQASQLSAVSAITVTVIGGGTLSGQGCTSATSCTIPTASGGVLANAAQANPASVAAIDLSYNAPTEPGEASVRATVVGTDGTTFTETLDLVISGSATELAVGGALPRVHSSATADDDRDKIRIPITAQDANGNKARMPQNAAATVRGVGDAALPSGSHTAAVTCTNESRLSCHIEIVVTATASQPLASGAYTATVTGSGIGRTEASFAVGGPAETLSISVPETLPGLAQTFTATVSVVDRAGVPVADGTWVAFSTAATGGGTPSAVVTSPAAAEVDHDGDAETAAVSQRRAQTKNGEVSANVTVVGNGISVFSARTGFGAGLKSADEALDTRGAVAVTDEPAGRVLEYNTQSGESATSSWATYRGAASTTADELLGHAEAPDDARIVWLWNGVEWIRYGEADGRPLPGSRAFFILPDDTVWFGE